MSRRLIFSMWCSLLAALSVSAHQPLPVRSASDNEPPSLLASMIQQDSVAPSLTPPAPPELSRALWLNPLESFPDKPRPVSQVAMMQLPPQFGQLGLTDAPSVDANSFSGSFATQPGAFGVGLDLNSAPEFKGALIVFGRNNAMKFGGYAKADFICDAAPITATSARRLTSLPI